MSTGVISALSLILFETVGDNTPLLEDTIIEDPLKTFQAQFESKDFSNALITLKNNSTKIPTDIWHFNMGVVFGEMNDWARARYHFLMAEKDGLSSGDLGRNLDLVESKLDVKKLEKPLEVKDYLIQGSLSASSGIFAFLSIGLILMMLWRLKKKQSLKGAIALVALAVVPMSLDFWIDRWNTSVVITPSPLFEGPSSIFGSRGELPSGIRVVTESKEGWEKIIYPSRFAGWIKPESLKRLE